MHLLLAIIAACIAFIAKIARYFRVFASSLVGWTNIDAQQITVKSLWRGLLIRGPPVIVGLLIVAAIFGLLAQTSKAIDLTGVVAFYDLANDANDNSGNGKNGTNVGSVTFDGSKATFSGSNNITLPSLGSFTGDFTFSFWANTSQTSGNFVALGLATAPYLEVWMGDFSGGATPYSWRMYSGTYEGAAHIITDSTPSGNMHICVVRSSGTNTIYINNVSKGTYSNSETLVMTSTATIGARSGGTSRWIGTIQSVGLYNVAKDSTWRTAVYNGGTPLTWSGMGGGGGSTVTGSFNLLLRDDRGYKRILREIDQHFALTP